MERLGQRLGADRFCEIVLHAAGSGRRVVFGEHVGGECNDVGVVGAAGHFADDSGGLQSVDFRHLKIHEHDIVGIMGEALNGFASVADGSGVVAESGEVEQDDFAVYGNVFGDEQAKRMAAGEVEIGYFGPVNRRGRGEGGHKERAEDLK